MLIKTKLIILIAGIFFFIAVAGAYWYGSDDKIVFQTPYVMSNGTEAMLEGKYNYVEVLGRDDKYTYIKCDNSVSNCIRLEDTLNKILKNKLCFDIRENISSISIKADRTLNVTVGDLGCL